MNHYRPGLFLTALAVALGCGAPETQPRSEPYRWYRGNLHTHTLWSDGDQFPEVIVDWYAGHGYDFVAVSDHNILPRAERWIVLDTDSLHLAYDAYLEGFGDDWVETRVEQRQTSVRLRPVSEYRERFENVGRFLIIESEEISDRFETKTLHVNVTNPAEAIAPQGGVSVVDVLQNNVNAVLEQRRRTNQPMFPHINHPNFGWSVTAEDIAAVEGENFFEVYNGHPLVHNRGDSTHASTERMWDIVLTLRLARGRDLMYGIAVDDAHHYINNGPRVAAPGRGWVVVKGGSSFTTRSIIDSLETGAFYASTGVQLEDILVDDRSMTVLVHSEQGITYRTQFIGTRAGVDTTGVPVAGEATAATRRYTRDIGEVLAEVVGNSASYTFAGDELYVRAKVTSTAPVSNPTRPNEVQVAWVQPVRPGG